MCEELGTGSGRGVYVAGCVPAAACWPIRGLFCPDVRTRRGTCEGEESMVEIGIDE
jgi:hypothetical protein